jgi:AraC-like DNA-binding protein
MGQTGLDARFPDVDRAVVAVAKEFAAGTQTGPHSHERHQFIFAVEGLMVATTSAGAWLVPTGFALWAPAGVVHDVAMHGAVSMRTAYVAPEARADLPSACEAKSVSPLLKAALVALSQESPAYDEHARGGHLAALILDEIARAPSTRFALTVPSDRRLEPLAQRLIAEPGLTLDIDGWAAEIGASRRTLTRLFRAQTGCSFGTWRRRLRLLRAAAHCADGEPLARAAARVGYRSLPAFRAMARKELGPDFEMLFG